MDQEKAKQEVVLAGMKLVETGLIARTWGNVSCRIDDKRFAITPSGMAYETLRPQDIVIVNIEDLSYEGDIKPSSEKGIHAKVYKLKPYINFVIHTHQAHASVAGVLSKDVDIADIKNREIIGEKAVLASFGLPGTKKLRKNVAEALERTTGRAVLMAHHGALCFGEGREAAFEVAQTLESECVRFLIPFAQSPVSDKTLSGSYRDGSKFVIETPDGSVTVDIETGTSEGSIPHEARLHLAIYRSRKDISVILGSSQPYTLKASETFEDVKPMLDDFAQIIGVSASSIEWSEDEKRDKQVVKALKGRYAVMLKGRGALCCAGSHDDAAAVQMILEKGCMTYQSAADNNALKPISPAECVLMHYVYLLKYAKKAKKV